VRFVLIDESTSVGNASQFGGPIASSVLAQIADVLDIYLNRDVATHWGGAYGVRAGSSKTDIVAREIVCALLDSLPAAPGAVAYHDRDGNEAPVVFLARTQCSSLTTGADSVSSALSHELAETAGDPACNLWADDNGGFEWCRELCDAVQEWGYAINGIAVSDFLLPAFFNPGGPGPFNFGAGLGQAVLTSALSTAPGGYQLRRASGGGETQVTGMIPAHRAAKKAHWSSRTYRRGARVTP
jgi:hypothetical protein